MKYVVLVMIALLGANVALANELEIINHFNRSLNFEIGKDPEVLPDLKAKFTLAVGEQVSSRVADIGKHAYIRVEGGPNESAFWGVDVVDHQVRLHGYISKNIAYSWRSGPIIFCTVADYKQHGHCV